MNDIPPRTLPQPAGPADDAGLMCRAIAGVLRNAQNGDLPLYTWTLGLPQTELLAMLHHCFPELDPIEAMPAPQYDHLLRQQPADLAALATLMLHHRSPSVEATQAYWLAQAISAACFGERHLWEDLGLGQRADVSRLLKHHFGSLYTRNTHNLRWKRFLFAELGALRGHGDLLPPGCADCDDKALCHGSP